MARSFCSETSAYKRGAHRIIERAVKMSTTLQSVCVDGGPWHAQALPDGSFMGGDHVLHIERVERRVSIFTQRAR